MIATFRAASAGQPLPSTDSGPYLLPVLNLKEGRGLINPAWDVSAAFDPTEKRFLQYPPGFTYLVSWMMKGASPSEIFIALAALGAATIVSAALLLWEIVREYEYAWANFWVCLAGLLGLLSTAFGHSAGRPDIAGALLATMGLWAVSKLRGRTRFCLAGAFLGALGWLQPGMAVLAGFALLIWIVSIGLPALTRLQNLLWCGTGAVLVFLALAAFYPFPLRLLLAGVLDHARSAVLPTHSASPVYYFFLQPGYFGYALAFAGAGALFLLNRRWQRDIWSWGAVLLLLGATYYLALRSPNRSYNLFAFSPIVFVGLAHGLAKAATGRPLWANSLAAVLLLPGLAGFARQWLVCEANLRNGVKLVEAQDEIARMGLGSQPVLVSVSLWAPASGAGIKNLQLLTATRDPERQLLDLPPGSTYLMQQAYSGRDVPPELTGFRLVSHNFRPSMFAIGGMKLATSTSGYAFARYERTPAP